MPQFSNTPFDSRCSSWMLLPRTAMCKCPVLFPSPGLGSGPALEAAVKRELLKDDRLAYDRSVETLRPCHEFNRDFVDLELMKHFVADVSDDQL